MKGGTQCTEGALLHAAVQPAITVGPGPCCSAHAAAAAGMRTPEMKGSVIASSLTKGVLGPSPSLLASMQ